MDEKQEWKLHPNTKQLIKDLVEKQNAIMLKWANGTFISPEQNFEAIGFVKGLEEVIDTVRGEIVEHD